MAGEHFCGEDWTTLKKRHQSFDSDDLVHYCFSSAYIVALLHDSLGIALNDRRYISRLNTCFKCAVWMQNPSAFEFSHIKVILILNELCVYRSFAYARIVMFGMFEQDHICQSDCKYASWLGIGSFHLAEFCCIWNAAPGLDYHYY